jgi:four helix bundle protein
VLNIAEGGGEYSPREKARFYRIARRSACETSAGADLLMLMEVLTDEKLEAVQAQLDEIAAMLTTMAKTQEAKASRGIARVPNPVSAARPRTP